MIMNTNSLLFLHLIIILLLLSLLRRGFSQETTYTINSTRLVLIRDFETIHSSDRQFTLGFFSPNGTTGRYMGIWYYVSPSSITWVANRENPLNDTGGTASISPDGNIVIRNGDNQVIWSTNVTLSNTSTRAQLMDSGNLVLSDSLTGSTLWDSNRHPVHSFLPGMRLSDNPRTGERVDLNSWRTIQDPARGNFTSGVDSVNGVLQLYIWENGVRRWRSGPWNGRILTGVTNMYSGSVDGFNVGTGEDGTTYFTRNSRQQFMSRQYLNADGVLVEEAWDMGISDWTMFWAAPTNECDFYNKCGPFALCYSENSPICSCLRGYEPRDREDWSRGVWTGGCIRTTLLRCERDDNREDRFFRLSLVKVPDFMEWRAASEESDCPSMCLRNCSCLAYAYDTGIGCMFWNDSLIDVQRFHDSAGSDLYIRVAYSLVGNEKNNKVGIIVAVVASMVAASILVFLAWWQCRRKGKKRRSSSAAGGESQSGLNKTVNIDELPLYGFETLAVATNNFDLSNKLGMGGFGPVYKGKLANGNTIAVKRLSVTSGQGFDEFMNEVLVISKLQHRNLVRLFGCCVEKEEKMLVYEYLLNRSLDLFLFDRQGGETRDDLDWRKRFNIVEGICRGLLYLHRDSRLRIIHRDLKPSNILLDEDWNPKISDFGMARIFGSNQDQASTAKVVGTYGYMAPEYAMGGRFSEKSDVFSFGVLILEIISGKKNTSFYNNEFSVGLLGYAWKLWNEDNAVDLIDMMISDPAVETEILRCLHIGLLCVQEFPVNRPSISTVLSMLSSEIVDLQMPDHPGFTDRWIRPRAGSSSSTQTCSANTITHTVLEGR